MKKSFFNFAKMSRSFVFGFLVGAGRPTPSDDRQTLVAHYCGDDFPPPYEAPPEYRSKFPRPSFTQRAVHRVRKRWPELLGLVPSSP